MRKYRLCEKAAQKYYQAVFRHCLYLLGNDVLAAEDCTQDVFALLLKKKDTLDFDQNIRGWLYAAADRICKDYLKRESRRKSILVNNLEELKDIPVMTPFSDSDSVFDILTDDEYQLLTAYYTEEYGKRSKLATAYGVTPVQLTKKIHSIRKKLKNGIK